MYRFFFGASNAVGMLSRRARLRPSSAAPACWAGLTNELSDELILRHDASLVCCLELLAPTMLHECLSVVRQEDVAAGMNMGAEDHGISKLVSLPGGEVVTLAGGWKRAIAYEAQEVLKASSFRGPAPKPGTPYAFAPHGHLGDTRELLRLNREVVPSEFTLCDRNRREAEAVRLEHRSKVIRENAGIDGDRCHTSAWFPQTCCAGRDSARLWVFPGNAVALVESLG